MTTISDEVEKVATTTVDAAFRVHSTIGPGLLESAYETCLIYELKKRGLSVESQVMLPIKYDDKIISNIYRIDLLVDNCLIVEVKAVDEIIPVHISQVLTYLKFSNQHLGLIINFKTRLLKDGVKRIIRN
jgi:GxxExxY protein